VWAIVAAIFIAQNIVGGVSRGRAVHWRQDVYEEIVYWIAFAVLTPVFVRLCRRFSFIELRRRALIPHLVAAPVVAALQVSIYLSLLAATALFLHTLPAGGVPEWLRARGPLFVTLIIVAYWKYWVIIGLIHGLAYARLYSREQRAAAELRAQLSGAQLDRLRAQLQPHFLFNTLNSIAVLLRDDPERARTMLLRLSELLRAVVHSGNEQVVPLSQELAFVRQYLDIQQMRLGERLRVVVDVAADAEAEVVPHFLIQPLVENAVQHGIAATESGGTVFVGARRSNGELHIEVTDTPAVAGEQSATSSGAGVGLGNTRERLAKLYDGTARLTMERTDGGGARLLVRLPCEPALGMPKRRND
jgi:hypothetical protein